MFRVAKCKARCCLRKAPVEKRLAHDEDVWAEENRIKTGNQSEFMIVVDGLRKVYQAAVCLGCCCRRKPHVAVEKLSFGLNPGECFALLGVNGAGKSTTFKVLTQEIVPSEGDIYIAAQDIS